MLVKTFGMALYGIDARCITIEVNVSMGQGYHIVGLPDIAVRESLQRAESAIKALELHMPRTKLIINLAPADLRKSGSAFDLPIAIGILAASEQIKQPKPLATYVMMGELSLDGNLQPIKGALAMAMQAKKEGFEAIILPMANAKEAALVADLRVYGIPDLASMIQFIENPNSLAPIIADPTHHLLQQDPKFEFDFQEVKGQENGKRAMEIAAAGAHNLIFIGPPGSGKSMMAKRLPSILPPLSLDEALETTRIHSVAGRLSAQVACLNHRPFRSPHHTISAIALVGGGSHPQPGEISLAHHGVLFLDELPEFNRFALEVMRQPMEERKVVIARASLSVEFPANFMLIASMNPCACGYYNHPEKECNCPAGAVQKYLNRVSGPLLDRIDLQVEIAPVTFHELRNRPNLEDSASIRKRVILAREMQSSRFHDYPGIYTNAQLSSKQIREICTISPVAENLLKRAMEKLHLSARAYDRILKVSRTIADLATSETIEPEHLAEAIQYRSLDRAGWAN